MCGTALLAQRVYTRIRTRGQHIVTSLFFTSDVLAWSMLINFINVSNPMPKPIDHSCVVCAAVARKVPARARKKNRNSLNVTRRNKNTSAIIAGYLFYRRSTRDAIIPSRISYQCATVIYCADSCALIQVYIMPQRCCRSDYYERKSPYSCDTNPYSPRATGIAFEFH